MNVLAIETTGPYPSAALVDEKVNITSVKGEGKMSHLETLVPLIEKLTAGAKPEAVAASVGPGSFTGIRIGVTTARALAQVWKVPAVAVPTLKAFAYSPSCYRKEGLLICPIINARRGQVYGGLYVWEPCEAVNQEAACIAAEGSEGTSDTISCRTLDERIPKGNGDIDECIAEPAANCMDVCALFLKEVIAGSCCMLEDLLPELVKQAQLLGIRDVIFYGDGIDAYFMAENEDEQAAAAVRDVGLRVRWAPEEERYQSAAAAAIPAMEMYLRGETLEYGELEPDYMRRAEAEQRLKDGTLGKAR